METAESPRRQSDAWTSSVSTRSISRASISGRPTTAGDPVPTSAMPFLTIRNTPKYDHLQIRCWKKTDRIDLAATGGHDAHFPSRSVFPLRFILRHYPIRSQAHGERKVFEERQNRFLDCERAPRMARAVRRRRTGSIVRARSRRADEVRRRRHTPRLVAPAPGQSRSLNQLLSNYGRPSMGFGYKSTRRPRARGNRSRARPSATGGRARHARSGCQGIGSGAAAHRRQRTHGRARRG